jgi:hypothetical protein
MKPYIVRDATMDDAHNIAPILRLQDRIEVLAASGQPPEVVLPRAFVAPKGNVIFAETLTGDPILIAGIRPTHTHAAALWMVGTPLLEQFAFRYAREAHRAVKRWHKQYPILWNTAWADNDLHVRWLKFMRFTLLRRISVRGHTFIEFASYKHVR